MTASTLYPTQQFFRVRNLEKYQRYSTRSNPWVKLYCHILNDPRFTTLPDREKWCCCGLVIVGVQSGNCMSMDPEWVKNRLSLKRKPKLNLLIDIDFIEIIAQGLHTPQDQTRPDQKENKTPLPPKGEKSKSPRKESLKITDEARRLVHDYEQISGHSANDAALRSCQRKLNKGKGDDMEKAATAYETEIRANSTEVEYRDRPHNWFGQAAKYKGHLPVVTQPSAEAVKKRTDPFWEEYRQLHNKYTAQTKREDWRIVGVELEKIGDGMIEENHPELYQQIVGNYKLFSENQMEFEYRMSQKGKTDEAN